MQLITDLLYPKNRRMWAYLPKLVILCADLSFTVASYSLALLLACKFDVAEALGLAMWGSLVLLLALRFMAFFYFRTYLIIVRFVGEKDYKTVIYATLASSITYLGLLELLPGLLPANEILPVVIIETAIFAVLCVLFRIGLRLLIDRLRLHRGSRINIAIFGAGELGAMIRRVLQHNDSHNYRVIAFFDDKKDIRHSLLNGIKVYDPKTEMAEVVAKYDLKAAIIGVSDLDDDRRIEFIDQCLAHKVKVLKVQPTENWLNDQLNINQLSDIKFEDLLNRQPIQLDEVRVNRSIHNKVVMVTGCAGSIGSEIVRQLLKYGPKQVVGIDMAETPLVATGLAEKSAVEDGVFLPVIGDVRDFDMMEQMVQQYRPDYVFHAAAYKHVPIMEQYPAEAIKANVLGTLNMALLASRYEARKFVMISTDKAVRPGNIMGASKRIAEIFVQSFNEVSKNKTKFITTRFGNVLGSNGSVIPIFKKQIEERQPITVTHRDVTRYFMTIPEACQLVLEAGAMGRGGEIFVFDMGKPVRIADLAQKMVQMAGLTLGQDIEIVFTGLRPGEKLTEELLHKGEGDMPTHHPKIHRAAVRPCEHHMVRPQIDQLIEMAQHGYPNMELVRLMKEVVPEFTSQNSTFSRLDKARKP